MNKEDGALICPYCGKKQLTHEPDTVSTLCSLKVCDLCGKQFGYSVRTERHYTSFKCEERLF